MIVIKNSLITTHSQVDEVQNYKKSHFKSLINITREIVAILFWGYVVTKLFVFDIDNYLINTAFPKYKFILDYKFFIIIGCIAIIWLITKNKYILTWSIYIISYPLIIIFWKIPRFILKQESWVLAFSIINSIISFLVSLKYSFIITALYLLSALTILKISNNILLCSAIILIVVILLITYINRVIVIFKRSNVHRFYMSIISTLKEKKLPNVNLEDSIKNLPVEELSEKQLESRTNNLQTIVLFNRLLLFIAVKLKAYHNSKLNFVTYIITILLLIAGTVLSLSLINCGIFKIDPHLFRYEKVPTTFTFFYYSYNSMLATPISELVPISPVTQILSMIGTLFSFFISAIFVTLLFSVKSKKHTDEINEIIVGFQEQSSVLEMFIKDEYRLSNIEEALLELDKVKAVFIKFLYKLSDNIK